MREFIRSVGLLVWSIVKWSVLWGPTLALDLLDVYEERIAPNAPERVREHLMSLPDPFPYLVAVIIGIAIGAAYHELRMRLPENLEFNLPLRDAIEYMRVRARNFPLHHHRAMAYKTAERMLRQKAIDGKISIHGRPERSLNAWPHEGCGNTFRKYWDEIPRDYWRTHEIDTVLLFDGKARVGPETIEEGQSGVVGRAQSQTDIRYTQLRVSARQIKATWPPKFIPRVWSKEWRAASI